MAMSFRLRVGIMLKGQNIGLWNISLRLSRKNSSPERHVTCSRSLAILESSVHGVAGERRPPNSCFLS